MKNWNILTFDAPLIALSFFFYRKTSFLGRFDVCTKHISKFAGTLSFTTSCLFQWQLLCLVNRCLDKQWWLSHLRLKRTWFSQMRLQVVRLQVEQENCMLAIFTQILLKTNWDRYIWYNLVLLTPLISYSFIIFFSLYNFFKFVMEKTTEAIAKVLSISCQLIICLYIEICWYFILIKVY